MCAYGNIKIYMASQDTNTNISSSAPSPASSVIVAPGDDPGRQAAPAATPAPVTGASVMADIASNISEAHNILLALSSDPTVDELAAAIGLSLFLDRIGKHATAIYSGITPNALEFLNPEDTFETSADALQDFVIALSKDKADHLRYKVDGDYVRIFITPYRSRIAKDDLDFSYGDYNIDLVVALDVSSGADLDDALREHGRIMHDAVIINITNSDPGKLGEIEWSDKDASSISEMVANLLYAMNGRDALEPEEATAFLTDIVAATNRFSNSFTTPTAMQIASKLMESGADQQLVSQNIAAELDDDLLSYSGALRRRPKKSSADKTSMGIKHRKEESEPEPKSESKTSPKSKPKSAPKSESELKSEPKTKPEPTPSPAPSPEPVASPTTVAPEPTASTATPAPVPQPEPAPAPEPASSDAGDTALLADLQAAAADLTNDTVPTQAPTPVSAPATPTLTPTQTPEATAQAAPTAPVVEAAPAAAPATPASPAPALPTSPSPDLGAAPAPVAPVVGAVDVTPLSPGSFAAPVKSETIVAPTAEFTEDVTSGTNKYGQMLEAALAEANGEPVLPPTPAPDAQPAPAPTPELSPTIVTPDVSAPANPAASIAPPVASAPEINSVPTINYAPEDTNSSILPPPPTPPVSAGTMLPPTPEVTPTTPAASPVLPNVATLTSPSVSATEPIQAAPAAPALEVNPPTPPAAPAAPAAPADDNSAFKIPGM